MNRLRQHPQRNPLSARLKVLALLSAMLFSAGCLRGCTSTSPPIHINPNMDDQPKYTAQGSSGFFYDGGAMRLPVAGTVARGEFYERDQQALLTGRDAQGNFVSNPLDVDEAVMARGKNRYSIYCRPCHGELGDGLGVLYDSGVPVASFKDPRIVALPDGEIFDTVTNGKGLMSGYRYPVPAEDRWAIIAYLRNLQQEEE
ncbi:MAG TPA: cytochrome c [Acidobacteriota bacterium]|nr:cytochrome c [Acidobacteriota bacterium]